MTVKINWDYPPPRRGLSGFLDRFIGPGTTGGELWVIVVFTIAAGVILPLCASLRDVNWTATQYVFAIILALDMAGGIVTNATSSAKRWYHRPGQGAWSLFFFVALHIIHIFIVAWLFRSMDWQFMVIMSTCLLCMAIVILRTPLYLQRPVALCLFAVSLVIDSYVLTPTYGLEWFIPFLFLKLLISHLLREEPYMPDRG
ncbi:MAG TPA: hypothetical protein PLJ17_02130 [Syntrophorhabdaceae bacterium]|nr:hypothetical protein [Syntrophorhabdaceae bacterium]HQK46451.1 hypothetical protein [Syntrophorhabdaceae bacterium]